MLDSLIHHYFRVPYKLPVRSRRRAQRGYPTFLFLHGIGNSGKMWEATIKELPQECGYISLDLLGFGHAPKPLWAKYDARAQVRSVARTLIELRSRRRLIVVGHSLGALVAVELARYYPIFVRSLVLCSPPLYEPKRVGGANFLSTDELLKRLYRLIHRHPKSFVGISNMAKQLSLVNSSFDLSHHNAHGYMGSLEATIINQTSLRDIRQLRKPISILYGKFDPLIVPARLRRLAEEHTNISAQSIIASHDVKGKFTTTLNQLLSRESNEVHRNQSAS